MFLLEPSVDPAVEQQAIGRVHRIGQARPVTVFRLITADTVEARAPRACCFSYQLAGVAYGAQPERVPRDAFMGCG